EHADADAIVREVLERQEAFEGTDATTGDDDVWSHSHTVAREPPARIGGHPHRNGENPQSAEYGRVSVRASTSSPCPRCPRRRFSRPREPAQRACAPTASVSRNRPRSASRGTPAVSASCIASAVALCEVWGAIW